MRTMELVKLLLFELKAEHGLSLFWEAKQHKILFDTGQTSAFAENAQNYNGVDKYIGLDKTLHGNERIILTDEEFMIDEKLSLYCCK